MEFHFFAAIVLLLGAFALFDLVVGVSNDAVNFLNPAIGSHVSSRRVILLFASLGILVGVTFSSGMMEVARKGIFHPEFFTMPNLLTIFLAVMITDIILLDTFSSNGLPTSTTVSVVFELLGAAVAVSILKIVTANDSLTLLGQYINTTKALTIIGGIFFAVVVAFIAGAIIQFFSRLLFTFNYEKTIRRYGAIWGGLAMAAVTYFILIKGANGASFMTPENVEWINGHMLLILGGITAVAAVILQILLLIGFNIFKPIVLIGTFAIAMAFAANDLVNFIGIPMAGWNAYQVASGTPDPVNASMQALAGKVPVNTVILLVAGLVMVVTLWISRKAQTVIRTGIDLSQQGEGFEHFGSSFLSRSIVHGVLNVFATVRLITPTPLRAAIARRFDTTAYHEQLHDQPPSFDLLRAAVNIMVASALISYGTAHKLPLSTTYVTFMVAMGASFADQAWGRESAVYRITGVLTVVGGWLLTALCAFTLCAIMATAIFYGKLVTVVILIGVVALILRKNHSRHAEREKEKEAKSNLIFNLKKVTDIQEAVSTTFVHIGSLLKAVSVSLDTTLEALFSENVYLLRKEEEQATRVRQWSNIIIANSFKSLRLLQKKEGRVEERNYLQIVRRLQKIADGYVDITSRSHEHVANHHKGLLKEQINDLRDFKARFMDLMSDVEKCIARGGKQDFADALAKKVALKQLSAELQRHQLDRIKTGETKTRLSILHLAIIGNLYMLTSQACQLLQILGDSFNGVETCPDVYVE